MPVFTVPILIEASLSIEAPDLAHAQALAHARINDEDVDTIFAEMNVDDISYVPDAIEPQ
jgi:hypothetical protein